MTRWWCCAALVIAGGLVVAVAQDRTKPDQAKLVGLDTAAVEARIGPPTAKDELADSNEAYWIYNTPVGTLSVHFQNAQVVDIDPADFPVEKILK
jgi:hypothetical protein